MRQPMRILMVSAFPRHGFSSGGVASAVETLALELSARSEIEAIEIVNLRADVAKWESIVINPKLRVRYLPRQRRGVKLTKGWWDFVRTQRIARAFRPTLVHGHGLRSEGDIATRLGFPSVVTIHGISHLESRGEQSGRFLGGLRVLLFEEMLKRVLRQARVVISISDYDRRTLQAHFRGPVFRIPNAVHPRFFAGAGAAPGSHRVLFAGSMFPLKNVCGIIRAFARVREAVPDSTLVLAGLAPNRGYLQEILAAIAKLPKGSAEYVGNLTRDGLADSILTSAAVVLFSEHENLPCIIAEAMASSRAVVSSNVGGVPEMVNDGETGFLVDPGDEVTLAASLVRLLQDSDLSRTMGERGHALACVKWSPARIADETISVYRAALREC